MNGLESAVAAALRAEADEASQSVDATSSAACLQSRLDHVDRRRGRIWLGVIAAGAVAAAVIVAVVVTGRLPHQAGPLPPTVPSPTPSLFGLARAPFLTDADLSDWQVRRDADTEPPRLSPCLTDPRTWGAAQAEAATYSGTQAGNTVNEFVLRFDDAAGAHRSILNAWTQLTSCRQPTTDDPPPRPAPNNYGIDGFSDEFFADQRGLPADPQAVLPGDVYATRVARAGNVVVIIEDTGITSDRPSYMLRFALERAIPAYPTAYPNGAVLLWDG